MHSSSGSVLLMVLIVSAILYLVAATLLLVTMTEGHLSDFELRSTQAFYAAESSVALGVSKLRQQPDYRTTTSDSITTGGNTGLLNVQFHRQLFENTTSLYHLKLAGTGAVPGLYAAATRYVERDVVVKPFALFARNNVLLSNGCKVIGNVHGNGPVILGTGSNVVGNVTSSIMVQNDGTVSGITSSHEPQLSVPDLDVAAYYPKYWYNGLRYSAAPLVHDTVALSPVGTDVPPYPSIEVYSGFPTPDNPAGVFYAGAQLLGPLTALDIEGTVVIPSSYPGAGFELTGPVTITPVDNFPALISMKDLDFTLIEGLKKYASSLKKNRIKGLVYSYGAISIDGQGTTGILFDGGLLGTNISLTTNLMLDVKHNNTLLTSPPPGIDFFELNEWREIFP